MKNHFKNWRVLLGIGLALIIAALVVPYLGSPYLRAARGGGDYLARHMYDTGAFVYEYDPIGYQESSSYNILRHAGTAYSLFELYAATNNKRYATAAQNALAYLDTTLVPCPTNTQTLCVLEDNEIKLGGNALAILAMAHEAQTLGDTTHVPTAKALAEFVVDTQSPSGEFTIHKMNARGVADDFISGYYPGEAIFALTQLYKVDGDERWMTAAHKGAQWLITVRDGNKNANELDHDHWLLYGLRELYAHEPNELYLNHARVLTDVITRAQHINKTGTQSDWNGGFYNPPRSTPTATRSEGLTAAYDLFVMAGDDVYAQRAYETIERAIDFQLRTQFSRGELAQLNGDTKAAGGFHESLDEYKVRIDYVQHNVSALLAFDRIRRSQ